MAHKRLLDIHPFLDGNGGTARLLMNLILVNAGCSGYNRKGVKPALSADRMDRSASVPSAPASHPR